MARPSATAALLLLLFSLLAVAHCRTVESDSAADAADETGPTTTEVVPADGFLRLPSHRRPCRHGLFHRHLWWARHHGLFHDGGDEEVKAVAEPDPDRSLLHDEAKAVAEPDPDRSLADGDDDVAAVRRWKKEMLWRMFRHHHEDDHHHHHEDDDHDDDHEEEHEGTAGLKRFHHHHHHHHEEDDGEEEKVRKMFHFHHGHHDEEDDKMGKPFRHHADDDSDSDDEGELEEIVRRFRKAILRRRFGFGHGRRFFRHHHHHHHAEEAEQQQEDGGVMAWVRGLMNRF